MQVWHVCGRKPDGFDSNGRRVNVMIYDFTRPYGQDEGVGNAVATKTYYSDRDPKFEPGEAVLLDVNYKREVLSAVSVKSMRDVMGAFDANGKAAPF